MENMIVNTIENILDESVTLQTKVDDINAWTSLKMLQIIMALEDEGIIIPIEKMAQIHSVSDIINIASA